MPALTIENAAVRAVVDPAFGARVLSLIDKRSGRDWMAKGPQSADTGEDTHYLADEAVGWDECFPTVAPWDATTTAWGRPLRDHGDLWGRNWVVDAHSAQSLACSYGNDQFRFSRKLSLAGETLQADYRVDNLSGDALPFLWALHALLEVTPDDAIRLDGIARVRASHLTRGGRTIVAPNINWPLANELSDLPLDAVHPAEARFAGKLYASEIPTATASVGGRNGWLEFGWNNREIAHLGLWLNYGGWPAPGEIHHLALEPTNAPADHLGEALETGHATTLSPGVSTAWSVTLTLHSPHSSSNDGTR